MDIFVTFIRIIYNIYRPKLINKKRRNTSSMSLPESGRSRDKKTITIYIRNVMYNVRSSQSSPDFKTFIRFISLMDFLYFLDVLRYFSVSTRRDRLSAIAINQLIKFSAFARVQKRINGNRFSVGLG